MNTDIFYNIDTQMDALRRELRGTEDEELEQAFDYRMDLSQIYHDLALEGIVATQSEMEAALDQRAVADATMIDRFHLVQNYKSAIDYGKELAQRRSLKWNLDIVKQVYCKLMPEENPKSVKYRKENPLHRLYFHDIAPPEKIGYRMRKLQEWLQTANGDSAHPIKRAAEFHFKLMHIFPFSKHSGIVSRLLMNMMLERDGYLPAVIHAIDRQRYYDTLRAKTGALEDLVCEAIGSTITAKLRFFEEAMAARAPRRRRRAG